MKSRDEIVIIMLQWLCLYTLGSRGSRELKTFLETRLISSRVDQKLKNKEEIHGFLKGKLARRSWPIDAVVGVELMHRGGGFTWRGRSFRIGLESATILLKKSLDRGTIGPRLHRARATIECRSCLRFLIKCHLMKLKIDAFDSAMPELHFGIECSTIAHESSRDRTTIGPQLHVDRRSS